MRVRVRLRRTTRVVALSAREFGFIGFERSGQAWLLQQWDCELL